MSKHFHTPGMPQAPEDDYELQYTGRGTPGTGLEAADEPLLPQYEARAPGQAAKSSPHHVLQASRRRSRACGVFWCLWALFVPLLLGIALLGCYFGRRTLDNVRGWEAWDSVPQEVKDWLESVAPLEAEHASALAGPFPTK